MPESVRFTINRKKVLEAIVYLASKRPGIGVFHILKVLFYADLEHFRKYGRPVLGDQYFAMHDGPVPSYAYDLVKRNSTMIDSAMLALAADKLQFSDSSGHICVWATKEFDRSLFSRTDISCLDTSISIYANMTFGTLWRIVHDEPAYIRTFKGDNTSTPIPYEELIPDDVPNRDDFIEQVRETAKAVAI